MGDILFQTLEKFNGARPWGRFLDAGTGLHSIKWIQRLETSAWTAITADNNMSNQILRDADVAAKVRPADSLIVGNWMDELFCRNLGTFDTILADYLIGAVDGFSPYEQDTILKKLKSHLNPGGRLFFIGMNPIPDDASPSAAIISEVRQARDACILLAGHRPYREFPLTWIKRHLENSDFHLLESKKFTILHSEDSVIRQIKVARSKLDYMKNSSLKSGMEKYLTDLESRVKEAVKAQGGRIPLSFDYVLSIQHKEEFVADISDLSNGVSVFQFANTTAVSPAGEQTSGGAAEVSPKSATGTA